jgi:O-antigen/teichoic acid export membrane protein
LRDYPYKEKDISRTVGANLRTPAFVIKLINFLYELVFHERISDEVKSFLKSLSYVAVGTLIASILGFAFNILAGRILGPAEYGKFTLVQSVAMFLYLPMLLGFNTAIVKYSSEKEDFERQSKIISTAYALIIMSTVASAILYLIFASQLSNVFSVSHGLFYLSLVFAVLFVFYTLTTDTLRGLFKMKIFAIFQPIYTAIALFSFLFLILGGRLLSFRSGVYSTFLAYGTTGAVLLVFFLRKHLKLSFDKSWADTLTRYGVFAIIGGLSFAFYTNFDRILINRYMTVADVGIYRAYYMASINVMGVLSGVFVTVFFPTASKYKNKGAIFSRINKLIPYLIGIGMPFILACEFVILRFYGSQYPFNLSWMILFAIAGTCVLVNGLYAWLLNSVGRQGIKLTSFTAIILALLSVGLNILLIPFIGITGAIVSIIVSFLVSIAILFSFGRKQLVQQRPEEV